jgi:hypothetical protein
MVGEGCVCVSVSLNSFGEMLDDSNTILLQVIPKPPRTDVVMAHHVPILLRDGKLIEMLDLDPTVLQVAGAIFFLVSFF